MVTKSEEINKKIAVILENCRQWISSDRRKGQKYFETGDPFLESDIHLSFQSTMLPMRSNTTNGIKSVLVKCGCMMKGVHLQKIGVPEPWRRLGIASYLLDQLVQLTSSAGLEYLVVESVLTAEMDALMKNREDFVSMDFQPSNYIHLV
jgi:hypothetical protein